MKYFRIFVLCISWQAEDTEQEIIELLLGALKLCDIETPGPRQIMYQIRSGLIYHNLANIYCRSYQAEQISDVRKKKLLQLCRLYYEKGAKTFETIEAPLEFLVVEIDRFELQNILFDGKRQLPIPSFSFHFHSQLFNFFASKSNTRNTKCIAENKMLGNCFVVRSQLHRSIDQNREFTRGQRQQK